jgi:hypothetical protein
LPFISGLIDTSIKWRNSYILSKSSLNWFENKTEGGATLDKPSEMMAFSLSISELG